MAYVYSIPKRDLQHLFPLALHHPQLQQKLRDQDQMKTQNSWRVTPSLVT